MKNPMVQALNMLKNSNNPSQLVSTLIQNNPQYKSVVDVINSHNGDAKSAFYDLAKEKGVNPDDLVNEIKNNFSM